MREATAIPRAREPRLCQLAPCPKGSPQWRAWDAQLAQDDPARDILAALDRLDLRPLWASYQGRGSLPHSPLALLAMVLLEKQRGRSSPSQWHRDQRDSVALLWIGQGIQPARSTWYEFRDRLAPFLDEWNAQVLSRAIRRKLTTAEETALDGTLIAACASRHRLLNQGQLTARLEQLEAACAQDAHREPLKKSRSGWPARRADAGSSARVTSGPRRFYSRV